MATSGHFSLRIVTWNIHKGVRGMGLRKRLEIHNMQTAVASLHADVICLQEVRRINHKEAAHFTQWPTLPQADFLAPAGYEAVYRTNAFTKHGEHGNALLSRHPVISHAHEDMSDHRFEQRGLLHATLAVQGKSVHVIVVHLGLIAASRQRQLAQLSQYIERDIPKKDALIVAGDFNSPITPVRWAQAALGAAKLPTHALRGHATFPSRLPLVQLDHVFARHAKIISTHVPQGKEWARMSDHLPLMVEIEL
ncbi:endonuclease/exonuclease/phosphatase family protein [Variovorax sp. PCZ-1]|uniref:endonuclease/exonuclease/phosphatase family protein n=1 Tax=Variovorax sp. PCZ-1 TaxID=2835533 RepID=UPI001BCEDC77|nr:endonuclease/exonuclease/phosphatase family protein [Variovorax sp. PCZ-1]MBS7806654.1 endonuclease/exonuclease/phosphatase family protein [Variovorax sp. PCZ-1]